MQKAIGHILAVVGRIMFIGLSIQIVLGLFWMCCSFTGFQKFGESLFYIEVSKSLLCDEYTGALYPVIVMLARGMEELLRIPYTYILYFVQLVSAGFSGYFFIKAAGVQKRFWQVWGSMVLLTFPMVMQCHMAVLPNSLTSSCILMEMAFIIGGLRKKKPLRAVHLLKINAFWTLTALLAPDYLYLGAVPVILLYVYDTIMYRKHGSRRILYNLIFIAAFGGMIAAVSSLTQEEGCYGRVHKNVNAAMFRRFAWSSLETFYCDWPDEVKESYPFDAIPQINAYPDNVGNILQPAIEAGVGVESAEAFFGKFAKAALQRNYPKLLHEVAWDVVGYTLPPVTLQLILEGRGYDSYGGRNYEIMRQNAPVLTKYYMDYSAWWMVIGVTLAGLGQVLLWICQVMKRQVDLKKQIAQGVLKSEMPKTEKKCVIFPVFVCMALGAVMVLWYALQGAGVWDYKNGLFVGLLWMAWMVLVAAGQVDEKDNE